MSEQTPPERTVKLFRNGRSQAVRIPRQWEFVGDEVVMRRMADDRIVIEPAQPRMTLREYLAWIKQRGPIDEELKDSENDGLAPLDEIDL